MAEFNNEDSRRHRLGVAELIQRLPGWALPFFISAAILVAALFYLWPAPVEFPMDDAYIHFVYARNLVEDGRLFFSFPEETGVATSSFLWMILLAAGYALGIPMYLTAKVIGIASLILIGLGVYWLLRPLWSPLWAGGTALLVSLSGNMLWFSLNGMETAFFLAMGMGVLLLYRAEKWAWLSLAMGLLALTRPEGLFLLGAIGLIEILTYGRPRRGVLLALGIGLLICAPWFAYLKWRTGDFLPTSAAAKQFGSAVATNYLLQRYDLPAFLGRFSGLMYPAMWIAYLLEFGLGGMALPPPKFRMGGVVDGPGVDISIWILPAAALVIRLMYLAGQRFFRFRKWGLWLHDPHKMMILLLFLWAVLHNLAYMILLPIPGTASRYGALNYIILWIAIVAGVASITRALHRRALVVLGLIIIALSNGLYWNLVYDANIEHMQKARIAAAEYVRAAFSEEELCAAFDVGSLRYYGGRPIVEIAALIDPESGDKFFAGGADDYLVEHGVTCLVLPGRTGQGSEGLLDFASIMGLTTSPFFDMQLVKVFEIQRERWLLGYLPTVNYQASVTIYRLRMK